MARKSVGHRFVALSLTLLVMTTCVVRGPVDVKPVGVAAPVRVTTPVKAHLNDGSTVVYRNGVSVQDGKLVGVGTQFDLRLKESGQVTEIPLDRVVALESFDETANRELTMLASGGTTIVVVVGAALLAVALFGSCPTVYSEGAGQQELEAELFSYSIAPLFETSDVDRLRAKPDANGVIQLEVRNEALETHYLNQMELLEVRHDAGEIVVPDEKGDPLALSDVSTPDSIVGRDGRDLRPLLAQRDGNVFRTDAARLASVTADDLRDSIELRLQPPAGADDVALLLTMRNSLLNTVLLYDSMLKDAGARSIDWMSRDLSEIRPAFQLASWYSSQMGMRVEVWENGSFREVTHVGDTGPIAWKELAVVIPVRTHESSLRVRLSFPADNWRIDQIEFARRVRRPQTRVLPVAEVVAASGARDQAAARSLSDDDHHYLQTFPGQSFRVRFDAGPSPRGQLSRTFLLRSRGYYTEWVRSAWAASPAAPRTFVPSDQTLLATLRKWRSVQPDFEARFDATRLPVR